MRLTPQDAMRRLAESRVARLATVTPAGRPHVVPITYAVDEGRIYTIVDAKPKRTRDLQRIANLAANPRAAVLADRYDDDWTRLWWVRADGTASVVDDARAMEAPIRRLADRYPQYRSDPPGGPVIVIEIDRVTGWSAS